MCWYDARRPVVARVPPRRDSRKSNPTQGLTLMVWTLSNRLLFAAIFISGASALIYQLIWVRLLGLVFGVSSFAVATVVAVFLLLAWEATSLGGGQSEPVTRYASTCTWS